MTSFIENYLQNRHPNSPASCDCLAVVSAVANYLGTETKEQIYERLLAMARDRFPTSDFQPVGKRDNLLDCVTVEQLSIGMCYMLWFNVGKFTHVVSVPKN
jgi:hypothetical protein